MVAQLLSVAAKSQFLHILLRFSSFTVMGLVVVVEVHGDELATVLNGRDLTAFAPR